MKKIAKIITAILLFYSLIGCTKKGHTLSEEEIKQQKIMDVFLIGGQSNAIGYSGINGSILSPNPAPKTSYQYYKGKFAEVLDEVGEPVTGSPWPSFAIRYNQLTRRKICFVQQAVGGSSQTAESEIGFGNWSIDNPINIAANVQLHAAIAAIDSAGFTPVFKGILWSQGESDAMVLNGDIGPTAYTQAKYIAGFKAMLDQYRKAAGGLGAGTPIFIFKIGGEITKSDYGYSLIRNAQDSVANFDPTRNKIVFTGAFGFIARGMMEGNVHYSQAGYNEMGTQGAISVVKQMP